MKKEDLQQAKRVLATMLLASTLTLSACSNQAEEEQTSIQSQSINPTYSKGYLYNQQQKVLKMMKKLGSEKLYIDENGNIVCQTKPTEVNTANGKEYFAPDGYMLTQDEKGNTVAIKVLKPKIKLK